MTAPTLVPAPPGLRPLLVPAAFAVVVTAIGAGTAAIVFGSGSGNPANGEGLIHPAFWPPDWVFWSVWLVIHPASGLALWRVWQRRHGADVRGPIVAFVLLNVAGALFLPIASLVAGHPAVLTLMDLNGLVAAYATAWLFSRYSRGAALWMLPYLVWMPITAALKIWLWALN